MSTAPLAVPTLHCLRPYLTPGQLEDHADRLRLAQLEDRTPVVRALLTGGHLPKVPAQGDLGEQLSAALQLEFPNLPLDVEIATGDQGLLFTFEPPYMKVGVNLHPLALALAETAPAVLPQLLGTLERLTRHVRPVAGPRLASHIAGDAFDLGSLRAWFVGDKLVPNGAALEDALDYARDQGHAHPEMVIDAYPAVYFEKLPSVTRLAQHLEALTTCHHPALRMLAGAGPLLKDLSVAVGRLPRMTPVKCEDVLALPAIHALFTVDARPFCAAAEVVDLHMQAIWQGGEPTTTYALEVGSGLRSQRRLVRGLRALQQSTHLPTGSAHSSSGRTKSAPCQRCMSCVGSSDLHTPPTLLW